jgi:hypothetical protein
MITLMITGHGRWSVGMGSLAGMGVLDRRVVRRVQRYAEAAVERERWPFTMPPIAQLLDEGLDLGPGVTFLVGENGSGKSTLLEGIAMAYGLSPKAARSTPGTPAAPPSHPSTRPSS